MKQQKEQAHAFERILLSYAEMCYSVALALTGDPKQAQELARDVLTRAWKVCARAEDKKDIKKKLLKELRKQFLKNGGRAPAPKRNEASFF